MNGFRNLNLIFNEKDFELLKKARELSEKERGELFKRWEDFVKLKCYGK